MEASLFDQRFGGVYTADHYIVEKESRKILAIEEDKGHYVDKPFAKRAIFNAAEVFHHCYKMGYEVPYFVLSCSTKMNNFQEIFLILKKKINTGCILSVVIENKIYNS